MKKENAEIIKLTSREILLTFCDFAAVAFFKQNLFYRRAVNNYLKDRKINRENFLDKIKYLKRKGYIRTLVENKEKYFELTKKGKEKIAKLSLVNIEINKPNKWDKKWRIVIFDVPEKMHQARDIFRDRLKSLNFIQVQKSVYIFPFECTKAVTALSKRLLIEKYVLIMISEIIQGEKKIIEEFLDRGVIDKKDIK